MAISFFVNTDGVAKSFRVAEGLTLVNVDMTWTANGDYRTVAPLGFVLVPNSFGLRKVFDIFGIEVRVAATDVLKALFGLFDKVGNSIRIMKMGTAVSGVFQDVTSGTEIATTDKVNFTAIGI